MRVYIALLYTIEEMVPKPLPLSDRAVARLLSPPAAARNKGQNIFFGVSAIGVNLTKST